MISLQEIIDQAVNPDVVAAINSIYNPEANQTITNSELVETAVYNQLRVDGGYILCPVPFLYNKKINIETGFAVSVDQDQFSVYSYMHNYNNDKTIILSKLPHCVHKAVTLNSSCEVISDELKKTSNKTSAILFINNLLNDLSIGVDSPIQFFDDKLYQQLLNRIASVRDPEWINSEAIQLRLEQLISLYDQGHEERVIPWIEHLLFGCEDNTENKGFISELTLSQDILTRIGNRYFEKGKLTFAIMAYDKADYKEGLINCGDECLKKRQLEGAISAYKKAGVGILKERLIKHGDSYRILNPKYAMSAYEKSGMCMTEIGNKFLKMGVINFAILAYSKAKNKAALIGCADKALEKVEMTLAIMAYEKAGMCVIEIADELLKKGFLGRAIRVCTEAGVGITKEKLIKYGSQYFEKGWLKTAMDAYCKAGYREGLIQCGDKFLEEGIGKGLIPCGNKVPEIWSDSIKWAEVAYNAAGLSKEEINEKMKNKS